VHAKPLMMSGEYVSRAFLLLITHVHYSLYSCVITPLASMIACFAASTTLSGVSFGQLIMTDLCGAAAMAKAANRAAERAVSAKRIVGVCRERRVESVFKARDVPGSLVA
jgi:hypothetical protein